MKPGSPIAKLFIIGASYLNNRVFYSSLFEEHRKLKLHTIEMYFIRLFVFAATAQAISVNYALDHRDVVEGYSSNVSGDILFGAAVQSGLASIQPFGDSAYVEFPIPSLKSKQYNREFEGLGVLIQLIGDAKKGGLLLKCPYTEAMGKAFCVMVSFRDC